MFMLVTLEPQVEGFQKENKKFGSGCEYVIHRQPRNTIVWCDTIDSFADDCGASHRTRSLRKR